MSRVGKKPITIPAGVTVTIDGSLVSVKGPKGQLSVEMPRLITAAQEADQLLVTTGDTTDKRAPALWGLARSLVANAVVGVTTGFKKELEINGIGFKAAVQSKSLILNVGYSHPVTFPIPAGIEISVEKNALTISGIDKQQVGQVAAEVRAIKKPEPYKGKGIKYADEVIRRKAGKVVKGSSS